MPRYLKNWSFENVVSFLKQHFFIEITGIGSGHRYYQGNVDDRRRLVEVQYHSNQYISIKSLQHDIIPKSGIPQDFWKKWSQAGNKRSRKKVQYPGATPI